MKAVIVQSAVSADSKGTCRPFKTKSPARNQTSLPIPFARMATKYVLLGYVTPNDLWNWLLSDQSPNLHGEHRKPKIPSLAQRRLKKRESALQKEEAMMRRFRLKAKHRRAKAAADGPSKHAGITWKGDDGPLADGTKATVGASVSSAMRPSTGTEIERFWMSTRICGHCKERGLWSKGSLGQCQTCSKFTDLRQ